MKCIGHAGASTLIPGNTMRSFLLAADLGADVIEFDVRRVGGRTVLAHNPWGGAVPGCLGLDDALRALAGPPFERVELIADLKNAGAAGPVVDALRRHGLLERTLISSQCRPILAGVRRHDPAARTAISVAGRLSRGLQRWRDWREEVVAAVRDGRYAAVMVHHRLVDEALVERLGAAGAAVHAWTVRERADVRALSGLGVDGVVAGDPRMVLEALGRVPLVQQPRVQRAMGLGAGVPHEGRVAVVEQLAG